MRTIIVTRDGDGNYCAYFEDQPSVRVDGFETKREAVGELVINKCDPFFIQVKEV